MWTGTPASESASMSRYTVRTDTSSDSASLRAVTRGFPWSSNMHETSRCERMVARFFAKYDTPCQVWALGSSYLKLPRGDENDDFRAAHGAWHRDRNRPHGILYERSRAFDRLLPRRPRHDADGNRRSGPRRRVHAPRRHDVRRLEARRRRERR